MKLTTCVGVLAVLAGFVGTTSLAQAMDWSGFYAGVGVGAQKTYGHGTTTSSSAELDATIVSGTDAGELDLLNNQSANAIAPSLIAGYGKEDASKNYFGIEGELDLGGTSTTNPLKVDCSQFDICVTGSNQYGLDNLGRVRAIVGAAASPNLLMFAAGGLALARGSINVVTAAEIHPGIDNVDTDSASGYLIGATFGAGIEIKATKNMRIRLEGMYDAYLNSITANNLSVRSSASSGGNSVVSAITYSGSAFLSDATVRAALLWQFD